MWDEGDVNGAVLYLSRLDDMAVVADFICGLHAESFKFSGDVGNPVVAATLLMPLVGRLLQSKFEEYGPGARQSGAIAWVWLTCTPHPDLPRPATCFPGCALRPPSPTRWHPSCGRPTPGRLGLLRRAGGCPQLGLLAGPPEALHPPLPPLQTRRGGRLFGGAGQAQAARGRTDRPRPASGPAGYAAAGQDGRACASRAAVQVAAAVAGRKETRPLTPRVGPQSSTKTS